MTIGIGLAGTFRPLLPRNTPLPTLKQISLSVPQAEFDQYKLEIWQGDSAELHRNERLGSLRANAVEAGEADPVALRVDFALSPDGILRVTVNNLGTGEAQHVLLHLSDDEL